jgi:NADH-quinone oxidoreductase subunit N
MEFNAPDINYAGISPIIALTGGLVLTLLAGLIGGSDKRQRIVVSIVGLGTLAAAAGLLIAQWGAHKNLVAGALRLDDLAIATSLIAIGAAGFCIPLSWREEAFDRPLGPSNHGEFQALLICSVLGMTLISQAQNLIAFFVALELLSIPLYVLCGAALRKQASLESGLKYLIIGSLGSATLLYGLAFVYGSTGSTDFSGIRSAVGGSVLDDPLLLIGIALSATGLAFKLSIAPFHQWTPDVYEGAPTPVTAFMSAATKAVALVLALRVLVTAFPGEEELWTIAVAVIACVSLAVGNIAALVQRNLKRMLAYSSVSHAGFMLIAVAANNELGAKALLFYLIPYGAASLGAFAVVAARERELGERVTLDNVSGMGWERPLLGVAMWTFMLAFAGLPLTGGFVGKFYVFAAAYDAGMWWLVLAGVIGTAISLYYYLAVIRALYMRMPDVQLAPAGGSPPREAVLQASVVACMAVTIGTFFAVQPLIDVAEKAAAQLPF